MVWQLICADHLRTHHWLVGLDMHDYGLYALALHGSISIPETSMYYVYYICILYMYIYICMYIYTYGSNIPLMVNHITTFHWSDATCTNYFITEFVQLLFNGSNILSSAFIKLKQCSWFWSITTGLHCGSCYILYKYCNNHAHWWLWVCHSQSLD